MKINRISGIFKGVLNNTYEKYKEKRNKYKNEKHKKTLSSYNNKRTVLVEIYIKIENYDKNKFIYDNSKDGIINVKLNMKRKEIMDYRIEFGEKFRKEFKGILKRKLNNYTILKNLNFEVIDFKFI